MWSALDKSFGGKGVREATVFLTLSLLVFSWKALLFKLKMLSNPSGFKWKQKKTQNENVL